LAKITENPHVLPKIFLKSFFANPLHQILRFAKDFFKIFKIEVF